MRDGPSGDGEGEAAEEGAAATGSIASVGAPELFDENPADVLKEGDEPWMDLAER